MADQHTRLLAEGFKLASRFFTDLAALYEGQGRAVAQPRAAPQKLGMSVGLTNCGNIADEEHKNGGAKHKAKEEEKHAKKDEKATLFLSQFLHFSIFLIISQNPKLQIKHVINGFQFSQYQIISVAVRLSHLLQHKRDHKRSQRKVYLSNINNYTEVDPEIAAIKRPLQAYMLYNNFRRPQINKDYKQLAVTEVSKLIGEEWKAFSEEQKDVWRRKQQELKTDYDLKVSAIKAPAAPVPQKAAIPQVAKPIAKRPSLEKKDSSSSLSSVNSPSSSSVETQKIILSRAIKKTDSKKKSEPVKVTAQAAHDSSSDSDL